jgi:hypothetical protein
VRGAYAAAAEGTGFFFRCRSMHAELSTCRSAPLDGREPRRVGMCCNGSERVGMCCNVSHCVATPHCVATCRTALQHVALRCSVPHCVATCRTAATVLGRNRVGDVTGARGAGGLVGWAVPVYVRACVRACACVSEGAWRPWAAGMGDAMCGRTGLRRAVYAVLTSAGYSAERCLLRTI